MISNLFSPSKFIIFCSCLLLDLKKKLIYSQKCLNIWQNKCFSFSFTTVKNTSHSKVLTFQPWKMLNNLLLTVEKFQENEYRANYFKGNLFKKFDQVNKITILCSPCLFIRFKSAIVWQVLLLLYEDSCTKCNICTYFQNSTW